MNPLKIEEECQPCTPLSCCHTPIYQQTNSSHCFGFSQGGHVTFLPGGTQSLSSMYMTGRPQPSPSVFHYYGETLNCMQQYCTATLPGIPFQFPHEETQNMPSIDVNTKQTPQPPPRTSVFIKETLDGQQKNDREKTVQGTVSVGNPGSRNSMAVTGDETETGSAGDLTSCQLRNPIYSHPQAVSEASVHSSKKPIEDALQKRELRLMKNREAARECRRKKKEYVKCLEDRVAVLENQNKTLIEELRVLKDIYRHKVE